jgi:hypothetical protein
MKRYSKVFFLAWGLLLSGLCLSGQAAAAPALAYLGAMMYQLPSPTPYAITPETLSASNALTSIEGELDTAQVLKHLLDANPYKPKHDSYLSWTGNPAEVLVSVSALPLLNNAGDELPDMFVLSRALNKDSGLYTAELQAEADWYAKVTSRQPKRVASSVLARASRVTTIPATFDTAEADTIAYGATTVYAYPGGAMLAITDVIARIDERKVEIAAGTVTQGASVIEAARRSMQLVNSIVRR